MDTKKKENLGKKANSGREYSPKGQPVEVDTHDFPDKKRGKAIPYGVYDIAENEAYVSIGISRDTAEFAVEAIRRWWHELGSTRYRRRSRLLITADCGGSNGYRNRLWKLQLQQLADELGMIIEVCHYPPGTSKWNKIEHRLFCHITRNWRGVPLETHEVVVNLVSSTRTSEGLEVHCWLDEEDYQTGRKVTDKEMRTICLKKKPIPRRLELRNPPPPELTNAVTYLRESPKSGNALSDGQNRLTPQLHHWYRLGRDTGPLFRRDRQRNRAFDVGPIRPTQSTNRLVECPSHVCSRAPASASRTERGSRNRIR